jgi:glutamate--cysteine ligase
MMKATASIQGNFDYDSEEDALRKFRLAMGVTSLSTALAANSPLYLGSPNRFQSMRGFIWLDTDPDRCGLLELAFQPDEGYRRYLDYALSIPVLFIVRDGRWIDMKGYTFRRFLSEGHDGWRATMADWALHLTTLFPEVRLKRYLEVRGMDSADSGLAVALMAWWKGILYDRHALDAAWDTVSGLSWAERQQLHRGVCTDGLEARIGSRSARELVADLTEIAAEGLRSQQEAGTAGGEVELLDPIREIVARPERSPATRLLSAWNGDWKRERSRLVESLSAITLEC